LIIDQAFYLNRIKRVGAILNATQQEDFGGTARFTVQRRLGAGAFGTVYEVYDHDSQVEVALKVLRRPDPDSLYRFKQEFRSLSDVTHPNLAALYELMSDGEQWFFTMELVRGVDFLEYVWEGTQPRFFDSGAETVRDSELGSMEAEISPQRDGLTFKPERLRVALVQLLEGILALHQAGKLHRDIKPSNVLITTEGRVVLLDFGLVTELVSLDSQQSMTLAGTPAYMSPEQGTGLPVSEASDLYSIGVMLYQALTGRLPFTGGLHNILADKQSFEPPTPREIVPDIPEEFDDLCGNLLRRDPQQRLSAREALRRLKSVKVQTPKATQAVSQTSNAPFVGRESHLAALDKAYSDSKTGRMVTVRVHGRSGMGKSALLRQFLKNLREREPDAVLLPGRCYEQESVPYKALDSLIDSLSKYLKRLPLAKADVLVPRDVLALARLFPVLKQVNAVASARRRVLEIPDTQELRRRSFAALRELLARMSDEKPVVLSIDDLQWGDVDSAALLGELWRPPDAPPLLLILSYRSDEAETSPFLKVLLPSLEKTSGVEVREVSVGELAPAEVRELSAALMTDLEAMSKEQAESIARESGGSPFFISELARHAQTGDGLTNRRAVGASKGDEMELASISLDDMLHTRVARLTTDARHILEVIAVAGKPLSANITKQAAQIGFNWTQLINVLRAERFIRIRETQEQNKLETYHDRIRETVVARLGDDQLYDCHRRLAQALEESGQGDAETLAIHFEGAGNRAKAAQYASAAAEQAAEAFAFDRAARLYQLALKLLSHEDANYRTLRVKMGNALANAGRGAEAAQTYMAGIEGANRAEQLEFRRRAAEQLLRSGHIDEGLSVLRTVLQTMGMKLAETPWRALLSLLMRRAYLKARGLKFRERDASQIAPEQLTRIDTCWSIAVGLGIVDVIRGADFQVRHLLLALEAGEPSRVARALTVEAAYTSVAGTKSWARTQELLREAKTLAERIKQPDAIGRVTLAAGYAAYFSGQWRNAFDFTERADKILRDHCTGVSWELYTAHHFSLRSLLYLGEWDELGRRLPSLLKEAQERGDKFAETNLTTRIAYIVHLAADEVDRVREEVNHGIESWPNKGFHVQHFYDLFRRIEVALYCGDNSAAWNLISALWSDLSQTLQLRVQISRIETLHLRARCAVAVAADARPGARQGVAFKRLLQSAEKDAEKLAREEMSWAKPLSRLIMAAVASLKDDRAGALELLGAAEAGLEAAETFIYAVAARRCRGELLGGEQGAALVEAADSWMQSQNIKNPQRLTSMLVPGKWSEATPQTHIT
jgi:serine/threonine protein kinase/tetratricopeptide (TPR) repeat protein